MLRPGEPDKKLSEVDELIISGDGYDSLESALAAGRKWRQVASSVFARMLLSVDFGDDDESRAVLEEITVTGPGLEMIGVTPGDVIYDDRDGLSVYRTEPERRFIHISMGTPSVHVSLSREQTHERVEQALQRHAGIWNDELKLAYQLVHSSLANQNHEARFILAVTAIEALIPYRQRVPEVVAVLDHLIAHINDMPGSEVNGEVRDIILKLLESDKFESIRQFGLRLSDRLTRDYGGMSPRRYFDFVYGTRSDLAHGNLRDAPRLSRHALNEAYVELLAFALDILEAWTPDYSDSDAPEGEAGSLDGDTESA